MYSPWLYDIYPKPQPSYLATRYPQQQTANIQNIIILSKQVSNLTKQNTKLRKQIIELKTQKKERQHNYEGRYEKQLKRIRKNIENKANQKQLNPLLNSNNNKKNKIEAKNKCYGPRQNHTPQTARTGKDQKRYVYLTKEQKSNDDDDEQINKHQTFIAHLSEQKINPQRIRAYKKTNPNDPKNNQVYLTHYWHKNFSALDKLKTIKKINENKINDSINNWHHKKEPQNEEKKE